MPAAGRGLAGPHARVAERLLEVALGPGRGRPVVEVADAWTDARLREARDAARESGIDAALAVPLARARRGDRPARGVSAARARARPRTRRRCSAALAGQLAVAVQNAQLHEQTAELSAQRESALASEREASKRLRALYEISRSFAQSLSLETTLEALAATAVDVLDVDAAVLRMPDARREFLVAARDAREGRPARRRSARDPLSLAAVRRRVGAAAVPRRGAVPRRPRPRGARPVSREGLDGRGRAGRDARRGDRVAQHLLLPPRQPDHRRRRSTRRSRSPDRRRSRSTTHACISSRRSSPTRCSARSCRGTQPDVAGLEVG